MRRAARKDTTQEAIVTALKLVGATVQVLDTVNTPGVPDLLVGFRGQTFLLEVKTPKSRKGRVEVSEGQKRWHERWQGKPVRIVPTPFDALQAIGFVG